MGICRFQLDDFQSRYLSACSELEQDNFYHNSFATGKYWCNDIWSVEPQHSSSDAFVLPRGLLILVTNNFT